MGIWCCPLARRSAKLGGLRQTRSGSLEQIRNIVDEYDLHDEVQFTRGGRRAKPGPGAPRAPVAAKYRDPDSGATWSGRGKPPAWIAGKDRQQFLVD
ncbi:H-NS family nucleoid-associated regulatory protein [Paraburkholderia tropica]|uniref:H-NS histone family protein n=1 Tax=Paraburkholderia tropica TaxID=92647 RepID=UPI003D27291C